MAKKNQPEKTSIRLVEAIAGNDIWGHKGEVIDAPIDEAQRLIDAGIAVAFDGTEADSVSDADVAELNRQNADLKAENQRLQSLAAEAEAKAKSLATPPAGETGAADAAGDADGKGEGNGDGEGEGNPDPAGEDGLKSNPLVASNSKKAKGKGK